MTTLEGRTRSALLVIDVQNSVVSEAHDRDRILATIAEVVDKARAAEVDVVWVQHSDDHMTIGSDGWQIVPELSRAESEPLIRKTYGDSFEATDLESVLAARQIGHLYVSGASSDACIRSTLHGAFTRGYDTTLVSDAHTTGDLRSYGAPAPGEVIAHTNLYWQYTSAPGRTAGTVTAADIDFKP
ncbi:isochorismatase family protein [Actinoplanes sp. KI2]|uniref:isochorismatase family protein n=1 Tax=Actinoplanes sp. KI2 TaxID=2983315 RepID=UPI0021D59F3C|nr:isochorismatase family protein [Actinoplanes sp. KI2]MCU7722810.1 isochorismatase family protein [Actinoplanes sp. KI2]